MATEGNVGVQGWQRDLVAAAQLAAIVQSSHDAIIGKSLDGVITSWNPGAERLYGYTSNEVLGRQSSLLVSEDHRELEANILTRIAAGEKVEMFRTRRVHKNGANLEVSLSASCVINENNVIVGVTTASRDAGDLALVESWSHSLLEAAPDAMLCANGDGAIMQVNDQVERLFGYRRADLIGRPVEVLIPDLAQQPSPARPRPTDGLAKQQPTTMQSTARRKDGSTFPVDVSRNSATIGGQQIVIAAARDATDRISVQLALTESEARFRQLADNVDVAFVLQNLDPAEFLYLSPGFEKIFGYNPLRDQEDPGATVRRVVHPDDWERVKTNYWAKSRIGIAAQEEFRIVRPDGESRWVRVTASPVLDSDGIVRRTATTAEDITDGKRAEAAGRLAQQARDQALELQRQADVLAKANSAKNEFLSRMSHELRTPLNAVLGFAQLLNLDTLTGDQQTAVNQIMNGGHLLLELIDDVLDIAQIENDRLNLSVEAVALNEFLTDVIQLVRPLAAAAGVTIDYQPKSIAVEYVHADQRRLRQVLLNLLSNAIKYNRRGGTVSITAEVLANQLVNIAVTDTGMGIRSEHLPRLFTPFDRLGAEATGIEGTGVGLALAHRLMTIMGGGLSAVSESGSGSTFIATIPTATDPHRVLQTLPAPPGPPLGATTDTSMPAMTVLYIEDNMSNVRLMEQLVARRPQWRLISAGHGALGLELATASPPDLVLLDLNLPDIGGAEVLSRLRSTPATSKIRVVVVSADANPHQIRTLKEAGADGYLTKPLAVQELFATLDAQLGMPVSP
ncbi:MAG: PAS domain S-box protein [Nakamurella sp.]